MPRHRRSRRARLLANESPPSAELLHPPESLDDSPFEQVGEQVDDVIDDIEQETFSERALTTWECLQRDYAVLALMALTVLANLALLAFLLVQFDTLPDPLPLHFDATGLPDRIESKTGILALPAIGLLVFGLNVALGLVVYRRERAASVLLAGGALFVQILMWLATMNVASG